MVEVVDNQKNLVTERDYGTNCHDCERFQRVGEVCLIEHGKRFVWEFCRDFEAKAELPDYDELMKTMRQEHATQRQKEREKKERERKQKLKERLAKKEQKRRERIARSKRKYYTKLRKKKAALEKRRKLREKRKLELQQVESKTIPLKRPETNPADTSSRLKRPKNDSEYSSNRAGTKNDVLRSNQKKKRIEHIEMNNDAMRKVSGHTEVSPELQGPDNVSKSQIKKKDNAK